jgi:hypothetical protein
MQPEAHAERAMHLIPHEAPKRDDMFGKTRDIHDSDIARLERDRRVLRRRSRQRRPTSRSTTCETAFEQVESQINSQFTSLATYAQIAQEQVELARV